MKKFIRAMALCMAMLMLPTVVFASGASVGVSYDAASDVVTASGEAYGFATVRIAPYSDTPTAYSESNPPTDVFQFASNGSFTQKVYMPSSADYGKYSVYLTDDDSNDLATFFYYNKDNADSIVKEQINPAATETAFVSAIVPDNAIKLGIDTDEEDYSADVLSLMYELDVTYADSSDFYNHYNFCKAICSLSGKDSDGVIAKLKEYDEILGIDFDADYAKNKALTADAKKLLIADLATFDYASEIDDAEYITHESGFKAMWLAKSALFSLKSTESWKDMKEIYTITYPFLNDYVVKQNTAYKSLSSSTVFSNLAKTSFDTISELESNFNSAVKTTQESASDSNGSSGSFGGGGGGSYTAPSVGAPSVYDEVPGVEKVVATELSMPTITDGGVAYSDVFDSDWFFAPVTKLGASGIINGDPAGTFRPGDNITRAEFAKLIVSAFSIKGENKAFADVSSDAWYEPYVSVAAGVGILQGYDGKFNPDSYITRQDAAVIIYRTANLLGIKYSGFEKPTDINDASVYAWTAIGSLYSSGVISGMGDGSFAPVSNITRAQAAQLLYSVITDMQTKN